MDSDGHPVIGLWVDNMSHATRWLLIPVRKKDVLAYVSGTKTLRDLRADPRQGKLYVFDESAHSVLNSVAPCDLPPDYPPGDTGEYLGYRETTAEILRVIVTRAVTEELQRDDAESISVGLLKQILAGLPERIAEIDADANMDDDLRASYAEDLAWLRRQADRLGLRWPDGCELVRAEGDWLRVRRVPPPPEELVGALQDRVHRESGAMRAAKSVRVRNGR